MRRTNFIPFVRWTPPFTVVVGHNPEPPRGPHRIEDCVIDDLEMTELLDWWSEWQDCGGEGGGA